MLGPIHGLGSRLRDRRREIDACEGGVPCVCVCVCVCVYVCVCVVSVCVHNVVFFVCVCV